MDDGKYIDIYAYRHTIYAYICIYAHTNTQIHTYTYPQLYHQALNAHVHICYTMLLSSHLGSRIVPLSVLS